MKNPYSIKLILLFLCVHFLTGCGRTEKTPRVSVSGVVRVNQEIIPGIEVTFIPANTGALSNAPHGVAVTDKGGKFKLKSRDGQSGVLPGNYTVSFGFDDTLETEIGFIKDQIQDLKEEQSDETKIQELQKQLNEFLNQRKVRAEINLAHTIDFTVPSNGTQTANFELTSIPPH